MSWTESHYVIDDFLRHGWSEATVPPFHGATEHGRVSSLHVHEGLKDETLLMRIERIGVGGYGSPDIEVDRIKKSHC